MQARCAALVALIVAVAARADDPAKPPEPRWIVGDLHVHVSPPDEAGHPPPPPAPAPPPPPPRAGGPAPRCRARRRSPARAGPVSPSSPSRRTPPTARSRR